MKNKITDHQSLLLEKQRLQLICTAQEKEIGENFNHLKETLNPKLFVKEAILEIIPSEIRENKIVSFILNMFSNKEDDKAGLGNSLFTLAKTTLFTTVLNYLDKYLTKE